MTPIYTPIKSFIQNFLSLVKFSYRQNDDMSAHNQKHNLLELIMSSWRLFAQCSTLMKGGGVAWFRGTNPLPLTSNNGVLFYFIVAF